jgi:cyclase
LAEALLVDTAWTLDLTQRLLDTVAAELPGVEITTVVNTHPNGDHCWGNQLLVGARIVASEATAHGMAEEIGPQAMTAMSAATSPNTPLGRYMRRYFGAFDFTGITLTPATQTFTGQTSLDVGGREIRLVQVGPAHTRGDTLVHVPDAGVLFAGDILFMGDHPVMWSGPVDNWVTACDHIIHSGASVVVPGHGPVTDPAGVATFRGAARPDQPRLD